MMLTVDVEPDWGVAGTRGLLEVLPRLADTFEPEGVRFTFFVVSDLLRAGGPAGVRVLRDLAKRHEIASHGRSHSVLSGLSAGELWEEVRASRLALEDQLGAEVCGFRGPFFRTHPLLCTTLRRAGYRYDATLGCVAPSPRNVPPRRWAPQVEDGIVRLPVTTLRGGLIPFCLTYLRLLGPVGLRLIDPRAQIMYLHPHELLPPATACGLRAPLRFVLRRGAGERAWRTLARLIRTHGGPWTTCREFLESRGDLSGRAVTRERAEQP